MLKLLNVKILDADNASLNENEKLVIDKKSNKLKLEVLCVGPPNQICDI